MIKKWAEELSRHLSKENVQKALTSLVIREIKTTMRYRLRMAVIKKTGNDRHGSGCGEMGAFARCGGNVNWYLHYGNQYGIFSKK